MIKEFLLMVGCLFLSCPAEPALAQDQVLKIEQVKSAGGITAWLVEDHTLPVISLKFAFQGAGAVNDGLSKQGLARLLSNTMDEGAGDLSSQEFQKQLSDHSISLSFNSGRDHFGGSLKALSHDREKAFDLLSMALTAPRFDKEPVERMRDANLKRIRSSMGDPDWIAARLFNDIIYQGHPYALNSGGTLTTLQNITANDLRQYKQDWLSKDKLLVSVTGDIAAAELKDVLDDIFGDLPETGKPLNTKTISVENQGKVFVYERDIPQTILNMALPSIAPDDPDYAALQVMNYIYGAGGFGSRLMEEAREKRGLTYGIYSTLLRQKYLDGVLISTSTKNKTAYEILNIVKAEMEKITANGVTEEELKDAKSYLVGSLLLGLSSTEKISAATLTLQLQNRPVDDLDRYKKRIHSVTVEDIQRVAKRVLNPQKMAVLAVGKPVDIGTVEKIEELPNVK